MKKWHPVTWRLRANTQHGAQPTSNSDAVPLTQRIPDNAFIWTSLYLTHILLNGVPTADLLCHIKRIDETCSSFRVEKGLPCQIYLPFIEYVLQKTCVCVCVTAVAYPGIFFGGGGSTNSVEDRGQRERGSGGGIPLVRGSGGSCSLVQEISFHIVKFSQFLVL